MLICPSDLLPQIVCPMDEDAFPPNPFCSAPPHSEPPPPLLPLSSITPSCANDGISGHRRSGRIQGIRAQTSKRQSNTGRGAIQKPSRQNPSPTKRQRERGSMVQASQSKQLKVESTHEKQNEDGFDFSFAAELQNKQKEQKKPQEKPNVSAAENVVEQLADDTTQKLDATKFDMDTCGGLENESSSPKGWVIGPLFQSFKSKMASFTDIVMSPVKLFRANSPPLSMDHPECELLADGASDVEASNMFQPVGQRENWNQEAEADQQRIRDVEDSQNAKTGALKYSKKIVFDAESSTHTNKQADECAITQKENSSPDSVPWQDSPPSPALLQPSVNSSASQESKISSAAEEHGKAIRLKPLPRKRTGNRSELKKISSGPLTSEAGKEESDPEVSDEQLSQTDRRTNEADSDTEKTQLLSSSVCYTDCLQPDGDDDDDGKKTESCSLVRENLLNEVNVNGRTLKPTLIIQQLNPDTHSAAGLGRSKRGLKPSGHSQELPKRKKLTGDVSREYTKNQDLLNVASDSGMLRGLGPPRDEEETLKPLRKREAVSTRANRKGKGGQEMLPTINEAVLNTQTESSPDAMSVSSLEKSSGVIENHQKGSSKTKPSGSCKRLKTRTGLCKPDVNIDSMDLETTFAITSTEQAQPEPLSQVVVRPDRKQLQSKCRNTNKIPLKRKSPTHVSSVTDSDSTLVSTSAVLLMEPLELTATDMNTSPPVQREESLETEMKQPSKRLRKAIGGSVKSSGTQETKQRVDNHHLITKESQSIEGKGKISIDPVYFEMTPFESNPQPVHSNSQPNLECYLLINNEFKQVVDEKATSAAPEAGEAFPSDAEASNHSSVGVSRLRSSARRVNVKPRRTDNQRRRCRVLHSRTNKGEEVTSSITMEDSDLATSGTRPSENGFSRRLLRSYSCPEIPSLRPHDTPWTSSLHSPHHFRTQTSHQHQSSHTPFVPHAHKSMRRARRHTVCSVEVEREIAPLCLRKEVYPSRRSVPYDGFTQHLSPTLALSPSTTLSALASCFLSSPLAFLSKKLDGRGAAAGPSTSSHGSSPTTSSFLTSPLCPSTWHLPGFLQRNDSSCGAMNSSSSGNPLECGTERREEEEDDGEDTSSSSQEYEDVGLREEKALSDSEIKVVQKHEERGKVSSIRIRKTLPKPQNNLTPMGLPKPVRLKKKEFSLEEIYTNKNFSKPPESRLETIFEVPLNRRNGSESWFGQRRVKRFLEFLEVGEARKPKKPLVGVGKAGISSSRTRRGGFSKDEPSLSVQDVDSLLCAKLDQLNLWLIDDQTHS